jgi:hypothetical protein
MWRNASSCKCIVFVWKRNGNYISQRLCRDPHPRVHSFDEFHCDAVAIFPFQRCLKPVTCTYLTVQFFFISLLFCLKYVLLRKAPFSVISQQDVTIKIHIRCWSEKKPVLIFSDLSSYGPALAVGGRHSAGHLLWCNAAGMWVLLMQAKFRWLSNQQHTQKGCVTLNTVPSASVNTAW